MKINHNLVFRCTVHSSLFLFKTPMFIFSPQSGALSHCCLWCQSAHRSVQPINIPWKHTCWLEISMILNIHVLNWNAIQQMLVSSVLFVDKLYIIILCYFLRDNYLKFVCLLNHSSTCNTSHMFDFI